MRLIDAEAAMAKIEMHAKGVIRHLDYYNGLMTARAMVAKEPTITTVFERHGRWRDSDNARSAYSTRECSMCGYTIHRNKQRTVDYDWNYCPHCGARMDGGVHRADD